MIKHTLSGYSTRLRPFHHCHCLLHCLTIVMTQWGPKSFCYCKAILPSLRGQKQSLNAKVAVTSKWKRFQSQNGVTFLFLALAGLFPMGDRLKTSQLIQSWRLILIRAFASILIYIYHVPSFKCPLIETQRNGETCLVLKKWVLLYCGWYVW